MSGPENTDTRAEAVSEDDQPDEARLYAEAILGTMRQPLVVLNGDLSVETANEAFYKTFGIERGEAEGRQIYELGNGQWDIPKLRQLLEDILPDDGTVEEFKVEHEFDRIGRRVMILNARRMERPGRPDKILLAIDDITERQRERWELEGQKEYSEKIVDAVRDALLVLDWDLRVKTANETFYKTFRVDPAETEGRLIWELGNGQWDIPKLHELLEDVLPEDNAFDDFEVEHDFEEIGRRVMVLNARRVDHMKLILLAIEDQTKERRSAAALAESETKFRVLVEAAAQAVWETDARGIVVDDSPSWREFTGQTLEEWLGEGWLDAIHPEERDETERRWRESIEREQGVEAEVRVRRAEGGWSWTRVRAAPVRDADGRIVRWVGMNSDISPRKEAEAERELLLGELNHRVKNLFAVIRSLAMQGDRGGTAEEYRRALLGRLDALVEAHSLALESRWRSIDLAVLAERTLAPYLAERPEAIETEGGRLELDPRRSLSLSLTLHELATNAVKYGALSVPDGRVRLTWRVVPQEGGPQEGGPQEGGPQALFVWEERGGPAVTPPESAGFGTQLIERVFTYELHGEAKLDFRKEGLRIEASFPLS